MDTSPVCPDGLDPEVIELAKQVVRDGGMDLLVRCRLSMGGPLDTPAHQRMVATRARLRRAGRDVNTRNSAPDMWIAIVSEIIDQPDRLDSLARPRRSRRW